MKSYINTLRKRLKQVVCMFKYHTLPTSFIHTGVPYFPQWESPDLVEAILDRTVRAIDDPNWEKSGAKTKEEYALWSSTGCGMACTKMLIAHLKHEVIPLVDLGKKCLDYGGYITPLQASSGLIYAPYVTYLNKEFGLTAKVISPLLPREIMNELRLGRYIIASVSPQIRRSKDIPKSKGGHLILMLGYDLTKKEFYFHNPSGCTPQTQQYATISFKDFDKFFSGRGIVISQ